MSNLKKGIELFFHVGARGPLGGFLFSHFAENRKFFDKAGVFFPDPVGARKVIKKSMAASIPPLRLSPTDFQICDSADLAVISNEHFFAAPSNILRNGELYVQAEKKAAQLSNSLADFNVTLIFEIAPIPLFLKRVQYGELRASMERLSGDILFNLSWFELITGVLTAFPKCRVFVLDGSPTSYQLYDLLSEIAPLPPVQEKYAEVLRQVVRDTVSAPLEKIHLEWKDQGNDPCEILMNQYHSDLKKLSRTNRVQVF